MHRMSLSIMILLLLAANALSGDNNPLRLVRSIQLDDVKGRIDHMDVDVQGQRLFVAEHGNNTMDVIDLKTSSIVHTVKGLSEPQGIAYLPKQKEVLVTDGGDGSCRLFNSDTFKLEATIVLGEDADNVRIDSPADLIYIGYGRGGLTVISADKRELVERIALPAHPEAFQLDSAAGEIYVNIPGEDGIDVVDAKTGAISAIWQLKGVRDNFPMALDDRHHRLFVATRSPAELLVIDTRSGKTVGEWPCDGDCDDLYYDGPSGSILASCGEGYIDIYQQHENDKYELVSRIPTEPGARTSLFVPEFKQLFVAVPGQGNRKAAIRVYSVNHNPRDSSHSGS